MSPAAIPTPVAIPTLVPELVARATVRSVAGPGMNTKPSTTAPYATKVVTSTIRQLPRGYYHPGKSLYGRTRRCSPLESAGRLITANLLAGPCAACAAHQLAGAILVV